MSLIGMKKPQEIVVEHSTQLEAFLHYIGDMGVSIQISEVLAKDISTTFGAALVEDARMDIENTGVFGAGEFDAVSLAGAAVSFEFLVRHIRKLDPHIVPPTVIPEPDVVNALLDLFHEARQSLSGS